MTITPRETVRAAVARAMLLDPGCIDSAVRAAAEHLALDEDTVRAALAPADEEQAAC